ncbi:hypothetical protein [Streptomyces malaysiense]|uniref:hypothetical protein n=1 Tax=Streptomyces malaysiense TaxID=1428626 RepID=UPI0009A0FE89|nr:hypothetical protein [Streptomyces malaysiense]
MRPIPDDLTRAHEEWHATYRQLAAHPRAELRRRLPRLSAQVLFHPYWRGQRARARAALHAPRHARPAV